MYSIDEQGYQSYREEKIGEPNLKFGNKFNKEEIVKMIPNLRLERCVCDFSFLGYVSNHNNMDSFESSIPELQDKESLELDLHYIGYSHESKKLEPYDEKNKNQGILVFQVVDKTQELVGQTLH